ncbi:MAG: hypothetical protein BWZ07_03182 [Alphaproteobacteria bacterium ADurb.BinA280]|nr:MAG: hypothetical protein BWZ07_03182 [Alphaproteobacteria bacterium ADurb.BinA280]
MLVEILTRHSCFAFQRTGAVVLDGVVANADGDIPVNWRHAQQSFTHALNGRAVLAVFGHGRCAQIDQVVCSASDINLHCHALPERCDVFACTKEASSCRGN